MMVSLVRATRAATATAIAPGFYNSLYRQGPARFAAVDLTCQVSAPHNSIGTRQVQCTFAVQLRFAGSATTPEHAVDKSNKLLKRRRGRPSLPPWSEAEQQAVRRFLEGLSVAPQRVASLITRGKTKSLVRNFKSWSDEFRKYAMRKLIPGVQLTAVTEYKLLARVPETLARKHSRLKALFSISERDLCTMLRRDPEMLFYMPEIVAERLAAWQTLLAIDHAQMVGLLQRFPMLVCHNNAYVRSKLQMFLDAFESHKLGNRHLAKQLFKYHPGVVIRTSCERLQKRCKRLATEFLAEQSSMGYTWQPRQP
eukprot:jgi/Chlat1/8606/Chrsp86S08000